MEMFGKKFLVGADPEVFAGNAGSFVSAHGLVPGTKANPHFVDKGAVQVDGMALEYNIQPASTADEFVDNLQTVQDILRSMIGDLDFLPETSVTFDKEFMDNVPREALELGCDPDFNAYDLSVNKKPNFATMMRTVGGHVHLGGFKCEQPHGSRHMELSAKLARALDETVGIYSLFWDKDDKRRSMYGQAGCFRPKTYGMEYRTLSNAWTFKPELMRFVYRGVEEAIQLVHDDNYEGSDEAAWIINKNARGHRFFNDNHKVAEIKEIMAA